MTSKYKSERIDKNFSYFIECEREDEVNVTLRAYGKDYTQTVGSNGTAVKWIDQRIKELKK